ncbi:MAG: tRNA lysidine(34) synthetase TilS [Pseudomonadota bacterium]
MRLTPDSAAPDPALTARFRADFEAIAGQGEGNGGAGTLLALAVSGGADSMAMLALAHAAFPGAVIAATVDHRLRDAAADEAAMVARHCAALGVPHATLLPGEPIAGASIQARAREARYRLLEDWARRAGAATLSTAHHADDQAETFLMRAARGSGVAGLAAIRPMRRLDESLVLLRPLLGWRRADLRAIAEAAAIPFADDPTNRDDAHDRTRFRRLVESTPWLDVAGIADAAAHVAEAEQALVMLTRMLWAERAAQHADGFAIDVAGLPRELRRRLARRGVGEVRRMAGITEPAWRDSANIEPFLDSLDSGFGGSQAGIMASVSGATWRFRPAPPRRSH